MKKLYFVAGLPDEQELKEAGKEGALIRNAQAWHEGDSFEACGEVMGNIWNIPGPYRHLWKQGIDNGASLEAIAMPERMETPGPVKKTRKAK